MSNVVIILEVASLGKFARQARRAKFRKSRAIIAFAG